MPDQYRRHTEPAAQLLNSKFSCFKQLLIGWRQVQLLIFCVRFQQVQPAGSAFCHFLKVRFDCGPLLFVEHPVNHQDAARLAVIGKHGICSALSVCCFVGAGAHVIQAIQPSGAVSNAFNVQHIFRRQNGDITADGVFVD